MNVRKMWTHLPGLLTLPFFIFNIFNKLYKGVMTFK